MNDMLSNDLTSNQKNTVYTEMLLPMKSKISQILMYDTNAAAKFLEEYNKITADSSATVSELMKAINSLEISIQEYEQTTGVEKISEEKGKILSKDMGDLSAKSFELSTYDFEKEFLKFREGYDNEIVNQNYQNREVLEKRFYSLQANLIMRKVAESRGEIELGSIIKKEDKAGLSIWVRQRANELKDSERLSEFARKINDMLLLKEDAVLIPELWSWLNAAEKNNNLQNPEQEIKSLVPQKEQKKLTFFDKLAKKFSKTPTFPLDISDIKKIDLEWLANQIPREMRIEKEERSSDEMYMPSGQFIVYKKMQELLATTGNKSRNDVIFGENNVNIGLRITQYTSNFQLKDCFSERRADTRMMININGQDERAETTASLVDVVSYAEWLDEVCGSNFKQEALKEIKEYYFDGRIAETKCVDRLVYNLDKLMIEYEKNKIDVFGTDKSKREKFYKEHPLKNIEAEKSAPITIHKKIEPDSEQHIEPEESFERI